MNAVHIQTDGMRCAACPPLIESTLRQLEGVKDARAYRSMQLTSVLYDPDVVDIRTIRTQIASAGFTSHVLTGGRAQ
jgi:cation transport ATPase